MSSPTAAVLWLIVALVLGGAEILTLTAVLGLLGAAALITSGAAALGLPIVPQLLVFPVAAVGGLVILRPVVLRRLQRPQQERFGIDALSGRTAQVLREISGPTGTVRIGGEDWSARALDEALVIPAGTTVDVIHIDGITAVVHPRD